MTRPRSTLVSPADTPYYHCIGRCVRRSYLCGEDPVSGRNFDHRKTIILNRLKLLTETFAIDLCAYALMSNHYHLVVRIDLQRTAEWSDVEIVRRWRRLYRGPRFIEAWLDGAILSDIEQMRLGSLIAIWRQRLGDLSWFMRCLNEHIARLANAEDQCTGRFWEGRFKSQALLDDQALLTAMAYVDLNPIRAGLADAIESSPYTSGQQRLHEIAHTSPILAERVHPALLAFAQDIRGDESAIPFDLRDYLELLDTSGRVLHPGKSGRIPMSAPRLLTALGLDHDGWLQAVSALQVQFRLFIGAPMRLRGIAKAKGWRWVRGHAAAKALYRESENSA